MITIEEEPIRIPLTICVFVITLAFTMLCGLIGVNIEGNDWFDQIAFLGIFGSMISFVAASVAAWKMDEKYFKKESDEHEELGDEVS